MYGSLLLVHSMVRWLVLLGIVVTLARTYSALLRPRAFTRGDRLSVALGTTASHTQLLLGLALYMSSPFVKLFWSAPGQKIANTQLLFFSLIHITGMITSVVLMTVGSSLAKRAVDDHGKFRSIGIYWTIAVTLILLLIPWPFSPLAQRPLLRSPMDESLGPQSAPHSPLTARSDLGGLPASIAGATGEPITIRSRPSLLRQP